MLFWLGIKPFIQSTLATLPTICCVDNGFVLLVHDYFATSAALIALVY